MSPNDDLLQIVSATDPASIDDVIKEMEDIEVMVKIEEDWMSEIQKSTRIEANVNQVASFLEDPANVPLWNPLVSKIAIDENQGEGLGSWLRWEASLAGIPISGSSATITWEPGREYAWRNTERISGFSMEGRFILEPVDDQTNLIAILVYDLPGPIENIIDVAGVEQHLSDAVDKAISKIREAITA